MIKKIIVIGLVLLILFVLFSIGYRFYFLNLYNKELDDQRNEWLTHDFTPKRIEGIIHEMEPPTGKKCFTNLIIETSTGERFASGICLCEGNKEFANFAAEQDSVIKAAGSNTLLVIKPSGEKKEFEFPFCDF